MKRSNVLFASVGVLFLSFLVHGLAVVADDSIPDLTKGGKRDETHDWNLGPTGARGWMWASRGLEATSKTRQILITKVHSGSPADGILKEGDVILGIGDTRFGRDARMALADAITEAEKKKNNGKLKLLRWRDGKTAAITLKLKVMGTYSATSPVNCPKTQKIIESACRSIVDRAANPQRKGRKALGEDIDGEFNGLGLLATGRKEYLPLVRKQAAHVASRSAKPFKMCTWHYGNRCLFLCEYYLATRDRSVLPAIGALSLSIAKGQSRVGTWGHSFAYPEAKVCRGYGAMNAAGQPCIISLILAEKCGIKDKLVLDAKERGLKFLRSFTGRGGIPYGDHSATSKDDNGKSSQAAVMFNLAGEPKHAAWHAGLSLASYRFREYGHTGHYFGMLWGPLGTGLLGPEALRAHLKELRGLLELGRRWDGKFVYQPNPGVGGARNHKHGGWDCTGTRLLAYCYPRHQLYITGKGGNHVKKFDSKQVSDAIRAGRLDFERRGMKELKSGLKSWFPAERYGCSKRYFSNLEGNSLPQFIAQLSNTDLRMRTLACQAVREMRHSRKGISLKPAIRPLLKQLKVPNTPLRVEALKALQTIGQDAREQAGPALLEFAAQKIEGDPQNLIKRQLARTLFWRGVYKKNFDGVDRALVVRGVKGLLEDEDNAFDMCCLRYAYWYTENWKNREVAQWFKPALDCVVNRRSSGQMDSSDIRFDSFEFLAKRGLVDAMEEYMKAIDKPSMEFYTVYKIFPMIPKYYGVESKKYLPRLKAYLNEIPDRFVQVQMITDVTKKTIEQIEKTTEKKKLVRIRDYVK